MRLSLTTGSYLLTDVPPQSNTESIIQGPFKFFFPDRSNLKFLKVKCNPTYLPIECHGQNTLVSIQSRTCCVVHKTKLLVHPYLLPLKMDYPEVLLFNGDLGWVVH